MTEMSDSDRSWSGQAEERNFEGPDEATTSSGAKNARCSKLCALEAAVESELKAGETSHNNKKVTGMVTDDDKVGETNRQRKLE